MFRNIPPPTQSEHVPQPQPLSCSPYTTDSETPAAEAAKKEKPFGDIPGPGVPSPGAAKPPSRHTDKRLVSSPGMFGHSLPTKAVRNPPPPKVYALRTAFGPGLWGSDRVEN